MSAPPLRDRAARARVAWSLWIAASASLTGCAVGVVGPYRADGSVAPPAPLPEPALTCDEASVQMPGHWRWNGHRYVWIAQACVHRRGERWLAGEYVRCGAEWCWQEGIWVRP